MWRFWSPSAGINNVAVRFSRPHRKQYLFTFHRWVIKNLNEEQRDSPSAHSIIQSNLFLPLLSGSSSRHRASGNREQRRGKRNRKKEGWRDRKRWEWEHISGLFPMTFLLSAERATMNINMDLGRGNMAFFPFHWAIHAQKKSIQVNLMANLCACAWLCEQFSPCSTSSLSLPPSVS